MATEEEALFGNESPVLDDLKDDVEPNSPKKRGGRTKEKNNARGIPLTVRIKLGYDTPDEEIDHQRKFACKGFASIGQSDGINTRASLIGSGRCNLPSALPTRLQLI